MKDLKFSHSCFSIWLVLVTYFLMINISTTSQVPINRQRQLSESLSRIDVQIKQLNEGSHSNRLYCQRNGINWTVSENLQPGLSSLYKNLPQFALQNMKQTTQQTILIKHKCNIIKKHSQSHMQYSSSHLKHHYVTSLGQMFIFVSDYHQKMFEIYSMDCELLARISEFLVKLVFDEEKTTSHYGSQNKDNGDGQVVYLISSENELVVVDLAEAKKGKHLFVDNNPSEKSHSSAQNRVYRVLNNKLILPGETTSIIGVLTKTVNHQSTRSKQSRASPGSTSYRERSLFVAFDSSQIKYPQVIFFRVFNQMGTLKINMKQPSTINDLYSQAHPQPNTLLEVNDKALQFLDIHPLPILVEQNWIYFVDTGKYSRQPWGCPYIANVRKLFVENFHDSEVYVLTDDRILKVNVRPKDSKDSSKKGLCEVEKAIKYFDPYINQKKTSDIQFFVHKNLIFLDNLIYNMTSQTYLTAHSVQTLLRKTQGKDTLCKNFTIQPIPHIPPSSKKTPLEKHLTVMFNCQKDQTNEFHLFTVTQIKSESSLLVYIIVGFMMMIFFAVKCFKSSTSNYEKELLYPVNFDAQDKEVRRQHYEQLKKYMDEAKIVQQQEKNNSSNQKQYPKKNKPQKKEDSKNQTHKNPSKLKKQ